jgi:hypothetical protein
MAFEDGHMGVWSCESPAVSSFSTWLPRVHGKPRSSKCPTEQPECSVFVYSGMFLL